MNEETKQSLVRKRHLSATQLVTLTNAWEFWARDTESVPRLISRARMHLLFLLIRYGGLRLGEAFNIQPLEDIDTQTGMISIHGDYARHIQLPMSPLRHIRLILALENAGEPFFLRRDPGFCRQTFYDIAKDAEIPPLLAGPRAVRIARKYELLDQHMPLRVVHSYLGLPSPRNGDLP